MSDPIKWEGNPQNGFDRRRLERCYNMDNEVGERSEPERSEVPTKEEPPVSVKRRPSKDPYWNFWRAVFAGWLIRYPRQIFKIIGLFIVIPLLLLMSVFSEDSSLNYNRSTDRVNEVR